MASLHNDVQPHRPQCLLMRITLRSTTVFEQVYPLPLGLENPGIWGTFHEEVYGQTFDKLVRQGQLHDPRVPPAFAIVPCPEELCGNEVHRGWATAPRP